MGFSIRFGGWRPVQLEEGEGVLYGGGAPAPTPVAYRFEVWHQMVGGFPGPFRAEGRVLLTGRTANRDVEPFLDGDAELELADGRRLPVRLQPDGTLLGHARPAEPALL
jgi:hypothetical protein